MITTVIADGKKEYEFIEMLKKRAQNSDKNVIPAVSEIIENVRENGDKAVTEYTVMQIILRQSGKLLPILPISISASFSKAG